MNKKHKVIGLLLACVFIVLIFPKPGFCEYNEIARLEELIAKATEKKQKVDSILKGLKSKIQDLKAARQKIVGAYHLLVEKKKKLIAFRTWNAFVSFVKVAFSALEAIGAGSSIVNFLEDFLMDRAFAAVPNPPLQAKLKRLSDDFNKMDPALRQLDHVCSLSDQEVADLLVSRGFVENTWLQRWKSTPEQVKNSASVITGRQTLILERLDPAKTALFKIKKDMDLAIVMTLAYVEQLERESIKLDADIKAWERQITRAETYEKAREPKPLPDPVERTYPAPSKSYRQAFSECESAWENLKSNAIDRFSYGSIKRERESSAWTHYFEVTNSADEAARKREYQKIQNEFVEPLKQLWEKEKQEAEIARAFVQKYESWLDQSIEHVVSDYERGTSPLIYTTSTIRGREAYSGYRLYRLAWWPSNRLADIASYMQRRPWPLFPGAAKKYKEWLKEIKEQEKLAYEIEQYCTSDSNRFYGLAQKADAFARELSKNLEVWLYVIYGGNSVICRHKLATLSTTLMLYEANVEVGQANMARYMAEIKKASQKASQIAHTMAVEPEITTNIGEAILSRIEAYNIFRSGNVMQRGNLARGLLNMNGITDENLNKIKELLPTLNTPKAIKEHALTLLPGEEGYISAFSRLINPDFFKGLKILCIRQLNSANAGRASYAVAFNNYASKQSVMESSLAQLEKKLERIAPTLMGFVSPEKGTGDWIKKNKPSFPLGLINTWEPPDPAYFYDSTPQDMAYLKKVEELLTKYQKIVLPVFEKLKASGYKEARLLDKMAEELEEKTLGWINLGPRDFNIKYSKYTSEAYKIISGVQIKGQGGPDTPVNKAYGNVLKILNACYKRHTYKWTRTRIISELNMAIRSINSFLEEPDDLGGVEGARSWKKEVQRKAGPGSAAQGLKSDLQIAGLIDMLLELEEQLGDYIANIARQRTGQELDQIHDLYKEFAACYSNRDLSSLLSLMSEDWSASDGSGIEDIEELLENSFSVFDNIKYKVENLNIQPVGNNSFQVSYTSRITGYISDQNLEHNETSQISDVVMIVDGRAIIMKTMGGNFWH